MNSRALPVPTGVVTLIGPVVAPAGTVAVILIDVFTVNCRGGAVGRRRRRPREIGSVDRHACPDCPAGGRNS